MKYSDRFGRQALIALAVLVFLWAAYRSVTVALTVSEAITYNHYASKPVIEILTAPYNQANQVLHSLLCRLVLQFFRVTEWSLRLPGLLGLLFYFWTAIRLCQAVCKTRSRALLAAAVFVANPFSVGWLPVSSGSWMGAGCVLWAMKFILPKPAEQDSETPNVFIASLLMAAAIGFNISFLFVAVAIVLLILHFNFWGRRWLPLWTAVNQLVLPGLLLVFALWAISFLNLAGPVHLDLVFVVLIPGLCALSFAVQRNVWRVTVPLACFLLLLPWVPGFDTFGTVPDLFHLGPEAGMPRVARALRDRLRRGKIRSIQVKTSDRLVEPMNFYRRRYALGAVQPVRRETSEEGVDYLILLPQDLASLAVKPRTKLFEYRGIVLLAEGSR